MHRGTVGCIYNLGGSNELSNLDVAKHLIRILCREDDGSGGFTSDVAESADAIQEQPQRVPMPDAFYEKHITFVEDRAFNDLRYQIDSTRLRSLGWEEHVSWEEGLRKTIDWYVKNPNNWSSQLVEAALVAHPRMLGTASQQFD